MHPSCPQLVQQEPGEQIYDTQESDWQPHNAAAWWAQVAFFLPQLVQQLRRDEGGLVEAFLLDSAARSQLFAHHLICALRVRPQDLRLSPDP